MVGRITIIPQRIGGVSINFKLIETINRKEGNMKPKLIYLHGKFYGYEEEIKEELNKNYEVYFIDKTITSIELFCKAILKITFGKIFADNVMDKFNCLKILKQLKKIKQKNIDVLFCIDGFSLTNNQVELILNNFKIKHKSLYFWDKIDKEKEYIRYFDKISSFDKKDSEKYKYNFRPTFFSKRLKKTEEILYKTAFIGGYSPKRYLEVNKILNKIKGNNYVYFYENFMLMLYKKMINFNEYRIKNVKNKKITKENYNEILERCEIILDVNNKNQSGLTQRVLDSLFLEKKLITTNLEIKKADFYNENNIFCISNEIKEIPLSFLNGDYVQIAPEVVYNYSIESWVKEVI